jgi:hypothetical protein
MANLNFDNLTVVSNQREGKFHGNRVLLYNNKDNYFSGFDVQGITTIDFSETILDFRRGDLIFFYNSDNSMNYAVAIDITGSTMTLQLLTQITTNVSNWGKIIGNIKDQTDLIDYIAQQITEGTEWGDIKGSLSDQIDLQNALDAKATTSALSTETTARQNADNAEITARQDAITNEANERLSADTTLQTNLNGEEASRQHEDLVLHDLLNDEATARIEAVTTEATARATADTALQSAIDTEASDRTTAIQAEAKARTNADAVLQSAISTKQDELVSGINIKTINTLSLLGSGNIDVGGGGGGTWGTITGTLSDQIDLQAALDDKSYIYHMAYNKSIYNLTQGDDWPSTIYFSNIKNSQTIRFFCMSLVRYTSDTEQYSYVYEITNGTESIVINCDTTALNTIDILITIDGDTIGSYHFENMGLTIIKELPNNFSFTGSSAKVSSAILSNTWNDEDNITNFFTGIYTPAQIDIDCKYNADTIGLLSNLSTDIKTNIVAAISEVYGMAVNLNTNKVDKETSGEYEGDDGLTHPTNVEIVTIENSGKIKAQDTDNYIDNELIVNYQSILIRNREHDNNWQLIKETGLCLKKLDGDDITKWYYAKNDSGDAVYSPLKELAVLQDIATETGNRENADIVLQNKIEAEATAREEADNALQSAINSKADATDLEAEATAREEADTTLQDNIDAEKTDREASDTVLQANIDAEAKARDDADSILQTKINEEAGARVSEDIVLQGNIGDLADLETTDKSNLVSAINELVDTNTGDAHKLPPLADNVWRVDAGDLDQTIEKNRTLLFTGDSTIYPTFNPVAASPYPKAFYGYALKGKTDEYIGLWRTDPYYKVYYFFGHFKVNRNALGQIDTIDAISTFFVGDTKTWDATEYVVSADILPTAIYEGVENPNVEVYWNATVTIKSETYKRDLIDVYEELSWDVENLETHKLDSATYYKEKFVSISMNGVDDPDYDPVVDGQAHNVFVGEGSSPPLRRAFMHTGEQFLLNNQEEKQLGIIDIVNDNNQIIGIGNILSVTPGDTPIMTIMPTLFPKTTIISPVPKISYSQGVTAANILYDEFIDRGNGDYEYNVTLANIDMNALDTQYGRKAALFTMDTKYFPKINQIAPTDDPIVIGKFGLNMLQNYDPNTTDLILINQQDGTVKFCMIALPNEGGFLKFGGCFRIKL